MKTLITVDRIRCQGHVKSKKRALDVLSGLLVLDQEAGPAASEVFSSLLERERLGSTGLGHGVALPHGRIEGLTETRCAMLCLSEGLDYDNGIDDRPVDIIMALLFPKDCSDQHLNILSLVAKMFSDELLCDHLRSETSSLLIYQELIGWVETDASEYKR